MTYQENFELRLAKNIERNVKLGNLPITLDLLNVLIITPTDRDMLGGISNIIKIISEVAATYELLPVKERIGEWDYSSQSVSTTEVDIPYHAPSKGEGKPVRRLHKNTGKVPPFQGQDGDIENPDEPLWTRNTEELF